MVAIILINKEAQNVRGDEGEHLQAYTARHTTGRDEEEAQIKIQ